MLVGRQSCVVYLIGTSPSLTDKQYKSGRKSAHTVVQYGPVLFMAEIFPAMAQVKLDFLFYRLPGRILLEFMHGRANVRAL